MNKIRKFEVDITAEEIEALAGVIEYLKYLAGDEVQVSKYLRQMLCDAECGLSALRDGLMEVL
jgi:hypothetical protein